MTLEDEFVKLEPLSFVHSKSLRKWLDDVDTWRWWLRKPPVSEGDLHDAMKNALAQTQERVPFAIFSKEVGDFVGETSYWYRENGDIEIGSTWMCYAVRGTGFNRKVKRLMVNYALTEMGHRRVILQTDELNVRCQRAIEKIGGVEFDRIFQHKEVWDGRMRTSVFYGVDQLIA